MMEGGFEDSYLIDLEERDPDLYLLLVDYAHKKRLRALAAAAGFTNYTEDME